MAGITPYTENSWKKTNYDRIISKTPEELADFLYATWKEQDAFKKDVCERCPDTSCRPKCWLDWLRQEAKEDHKE